MYVQDIAVEPTLESNQSILGLCHSDADDSRFGYNSNAFEVAEINHKGHVVWQSPAINVYNADSLRTHKNSAGQLELQIGNESMALLVK